MGNDGHLTARTTAGEVFGADDARALARLVFKRFGRDVAVAAAAWRRLLGNGCTDGQFAALVGDDANGGAP